MKAILALSIFFSGSFGYSQISNCQQEAQIIAQVARIKKETLISCVVEINPLTILQYNTNLLCELPFIDVLNLGVEVGFDDSHRCRFASGSRISGVLVKNSDIIYLE